MIAFKRFRGKSKQGIGNDPDNLKYVWTYGDYYQRSFDSNFLIKDFIVDESANKCTEVFSDSVSENTGIKDSNYNYIFENDFVRYTDSFLVGETYGVVTKKDSELYMINLILYRDYSVRGLLNYSWTLDINNLQNRRYEIIGNTYDNPELLINFASVATTNRIIKFKGKALSDGNWYSGQYFSTEKDNTSIHYIVDPKLGRISIDPLTLSQFTNFIDSYNQEIYENDVLRLESFITEGIVYYDIVSGSYRVTVNEPVPRNLLLSELVGLKDACKVLCNKYDRQ